MTTGMFLAYVNNLTVTEQVKEKLRALLTKMPTTALRSVVKNIHEYIRRFEAECHRELFGLSNGLPPLDADEDEEYITTIPEDFNITKRESKYAASSEKEEEAVSNGSGQEEEIRPVKWVNACEGPHPSGPAPDGGREGDRLHAEVPDRDVGHGGLGGEHREPAAELLGEAADRPAVEGEHDDRLRADADGPGRLQGGDNAD